MRPMTLLAFCRVFGVAVFPILATAGEPSACQFLSLLQLEVRRHVGLEQIPCVIHQTWKTHTLDSNQEDFVKSWTSKNPECQHKLWNDTEIAELCKSKSPDLMWPIWEALTPDVFRYLVLWDQGGYYADLDVTCSQPISTYHHPQDVNFLVGYEAGHQLTESGRGDVGFTRVEQLEQWFLASAPGNPVLLRSLEILKEKFLWKIRETVELTGPATFSDAVHEFLAEAVADGVQMEADQAGTFREMVQIHCTYKGSDWDARKECCQRWTWLSPTFKQSQQGLRPGPSRVTRYLQALLELIFSTGVAQLGSPSLGPAQNRVFHISPRNRLVRTYAAVGATWTGPSLDIAQAPDPETMNRWEGVMEKLPGGVRIDLGQTVDEERDDGEEQWSSNNEIFAAFRFGRQRGAIFVAVRTTGTRDARAHSEGTRDAGGSDAARKAFSMPFPIWGWGPEEEQMSFTERLERDGFIMVLICCARGTAAQKATALFELFADVCAAQLGGVDPHLVWDPRGVEGNGSPNGYANPAVTEPRWFLLHGRRGKVGEGIPISRAAQGLAEPQDEEACVTLPPSKSPAVLEIEVWANDYGLLAGYVCVRSLWPFTSLKCLDNEELRRRGLPFVVWSSRDPAAACRVGELHLGISWAPRNQQKPQVGTLSLCVNRLRLFDQAAEMEALELPRPSLKAFALDQDGQRRPIVRQGQRGFAQMDGLLRAWAYQPFQSLSWISKDAQLNPDNSWTWGRDLLHSTNDLRMAVPALPRCREVISLQRCRQVAEVLVRRSSLYLTAWQVVQLADRCFHRAGHSFALLDALLLPGLEVPPQQPGWRRYCDESGRQYLDVTPQLSMVLERQLSDGGRRLRLQGLETLQLTDPFPDLSKILWLRFLRDGEESSCAIRLENGLGPLTEVEMDSDATLHVLTKEEFISCILAHPELSEPLRRHSYLALDALGALTLDVMVEWTAAQYLPVLFGDGQGLAVGGHSRFEDGAGHEIKVFGSDTIWDFLEKLKSACQVLALKLQRAEALSKKYQAVAGSGQHEVYAFVPPTSNPKDSLEAVVKAHGDTSSWQILDKDCTFQSYAGLLKHHGMPPCLKVQWKR
ncbi:unnamed protein product [Durusdinium trenchii]|uniref:Uncharacterized protein n=1 Tax=Durusdinium trenchii TaxID=1381693 RepID=A0ABP0I7U5_9DINO